MDGWMDILEPMRRTTNHCKNLHGLRIFLPPANCRSFVHRTGYETTIFGPGTICPTDTLDLFSIKSTPAIQVFQVW